MKRWGAILLLCIYTAGATELEQLLRMPLLVQHYIQHRAENPQITIAGFLTIHYVEPQPFDSDYEEDMQLPFKQADEHCLSFSWQLPASFCYTLPAKPLQKSNHLVFNSRIAPSFYKASVFKPPCPTASVA